MRCQILAFVALAAFAVETSAQLPAVAPTFRAQTAMGALGQQDVMNRGGGYRVAARTGAGSSQPNVGQAKPFSAMSSSPALSPYLNLFLADNGSTTPNYHAFVRPQQEQLEANRQQQRQLQQLQRQIQQATYTSPATGVSGGARFGDTGRYYGGWRR